MKRNTVHLVIILIISAAIIIISNLMFSQWSLLISIPLGFIIGWVAGKLILDKRKLNTTEDWMVPAIPPDDYKGSIGKWMVSLQERGLWDGEGWHGDVMISTKDFFEILEENE
jgi:hypothetical protein